ncbi:MAG: citramalate synthase [Candidatus Bathyarchaeota archaeon]|nr:MAG: citramalate synthase [Candidatus Bathyarchaeota archaeon]
MTDLSSRLPQHVLLYDVTLRDGNQTPGVGFTLEDKLEISQKLDSLRIDFIEGGWPYSSLTDVTFFQKAKDLELEHAKIVAFGSTRHSKNPVNKDPNLELLLKCDADIITIFGKSSEEQAREVLKTTPETNLTMIGESIDYLKDHGFITFFDAEHYFDGFKINPDYSLETLKAAKNADAIILCDTNGGFIPEMIEFVVNKSRQKIGGKVCGIHCHNDSGLANANTIAALKCGLTQIQGGFCGMGERAGNVDFCELLPTLRYKYNYQTISDANMRKLKSYADYFERISGFKMPLNKPYVGNYVFKHTGGIHADGVLKFAKAYEHINPELVGNRRDFTLSDQAGSASIVAVAEKFGFKLNKKDPVVKKILNNVKGRHHITDTQLYLLLAEEREKKPLPFELIDYKLMDSKGEKPRTWVKVRIEKRDWEEISEGVGPVHSFDCALRKVLSRHLTAKIEKVQLTSYHVTIHQEEKGTAALTEVSIGFRANGERGSTIGESEDILKASVPPLVDAYTYFLFKMNSHSNGI